MAKRRYNTGINALSYADSKVPYVAQPTKEILGLLDNREERYINSKTNINLANELKKNIPYNPVSQGLYDDLVTKVNTTIDSITPENYADAELDTAQLSNDILNKFGGKELQAQQAKYAADLAAIDARDKIRAEKKEYKKQQLANSLKPLQMNPDGTINKGDSVLPKLIDDRDLYKEINDKLEGWKSNGYYKRNEDGSLELLKDISGSLGTTKTTFNDEGELFSYALGAMTNNPEIEEYMTDEAEFNLATSNMTPQDILNATSQEQLKLLFPNKKPTDVTVADILTLGNGNPDIFNKLAKSNYKNNLKTNIASDMAAKWGFKDDVINFNVDYALRKELDAQYKKATTPADTSDLAYLRAATTTQIGNPNIYTAREEATKALQQQYITAKQNYDSLTKEAARAIASNNPQRAVELKTVIANAKIQMDAANQEIQDNSNAINNITKATIQLAKNNGIDADVTYQTDLPIIEKETRAINAGAMYYNGFSTDVTAKIKTIEPTNTKTNYNRAEYRDIKSNKVAKLNIPGYSDTYLPVYNTSELANGKSIDKLYIIENQGTYKLVGNPADKYDSQSDYKTKQQGILNALAQDVTPFNTVLNPATIFKTSNNIKTVPTSDEYKEAVSKKFMNPDTDFSQSSYYVPKSVNNLASKISEKAKPSDVNVNDTLDYLYVTDKAKKGTAAYELNLINKSMGETFKSEGGGYKIISPKTGQWEDLTVYLNSIGLEFSDAHINFNDTKNNIRTMTTSDRKYGPKLNMAITLTKDGREKLKGTIHDFADSRSGTLNFTAVNATGKDSGFNMKLKDINYKAFVESYNDKSPSSEENRKTYGLMEFQNSSYAQAFDDLNLYTLPDGGFASYKTPLGNNIVIHAVKRSASPDKLGDNDFYLKNENGDIFVQPLDGSAPKFIKFDEYSADTEQKKYRLQMYASPEDIQAEMGKVMLLKRSQNSNAPEIKTEQVKTTGSSYTIQPESIKSDNHAKTVRETKVSYGGKMSPNNFTTLNGKEVSYNTMVKPSDVADLRDYTDNISGANLPYVNKSVIDKVATLANDYGVTITSALRDVDSNKGLKGSANDSMHLYGKSIDARYDDKGAKLLADLSNNPQLANDLGISYAFKHVVDGVAHVHIEFI